MTTTIIFMGLFTFAASSLVWARFKFFKSTSSVSTAAKLTYDPIVLINLIAPYWLLIQSPTPQVEPWIFYLGITFLSIGLILFWWALFSASGIPFAFVSPNDAVFQRGAFALVRHPFYLSYILIWLGETLALDSIILSITLVYLVTFYLHRAWKEEEAIKKSSIAPTYKEYCKKVGMFLPRIYRWKS